MLLEEDGALVQRKAIELVPGSAVRLNRYNSDSEPWSYVIPSVTLAVILLSVVKRSIRIGIRVERR